MPELKGSSPSNLKTVSQQTVNTCFNEENDPAKIVASLNQKYALSGNAFEVFKEAVAYLKKNHDPQIYNFALDLAQDVPEKPRALGMLKPFQV